MNFLKKLYENITNIAEHATKIYEQHVVDPNFMPAIASYVYFLNLYFKFKYEYYVNNFRKEHDERIDLEPINKITTDINSAVKSLNEEFGKIDKKYKFDIMKEGGAEGTFYEQHKAKMQRWTDKTPRDKIIRTLETWFEGVHGDNAVIAALHRMQHDATYLFEYVLHVNDYKTTTNIAINHIYTDIIKQLMKYYFRHRDRYLHVSDRRSIKIKNNIVRIIILDEFIDLNIKFKECNFSRFASTIKTFIEAINRVDVRIIKTTIANIPGVDMGNEIYLRRDLKRKICSIAADIEEDAICVNVKEISANTPRGVDVKTLIEMVSRFVQLEEKATRELSAIHELLQLQMQNINTLRTELMELCGPSTVPCIMRLAPGIRFALGDNFNKGEPNKIGEKLIEEILC